MDECDVDVRILFVQYLFLWVSITYLQLDDTPLKVHFDSSKRASAVCGHQRRL